MKPLLITITCLLLFVFSGCKNNRTTNELIKAIRTGDALKVETLIQEENPDLNSPDEAGNIPLIYAFNIGEKQIIKLLLKKGAYPNIRDDEGSTPLMLAIDYGDKEIVMFIIELLTEIAANSNREASTIWDLFSEHKDILKLKLDKYVKENSKDYKEILLLHAAAKKGDNKEIDRLIAKGIDVNERDLDGKTPLMLAAEQGHVEAVKKLLQEGADVNETDYGDKSAIAVAASRGDLLIVLLLIEQGADLEQAGMDDLSAFLYAIFSKHEKLVESFFKKYSKKMAVKELQKALEYAKGNQDKLVARLANQLAKVDAGRKGEKAKRRKDKVGLIAKGKGQKDVGERLESGKEEKQQRQIRNINDRPEKLYQGLESGQISVSDPMLSKLDLKMKDKDGQNLLMLGVNNKNYKVMKIFIKRGIDINAKNQWGQTALMISALHSDLQAMEILLQNGADTNVVNNSGQTALMFACYNNNVKAVQMLLKAGASPYIIDFYGRTAHSWAMGQGNKEVIEVLEKKVGSF